MPENGGGWHHVNAGPHLHVMFPPNRQLLGREADGIERPSIVVAVGPRRQNGEAVASSEPSTFRAQSNDFEAGEESHATQGASQRQQKGKAAEKAISRELTIARGSQPLTRH